jgi:hypothetical protein
LYYALGKTGIDAGKVICLDDIKFSLSPSSTGSIIFISIIGLALIFVWHIAFPDENKQLEKFRSQFGKRYLKFFLFIKKTGRKVSPKSLRKIIDVALLNLGLITIFILEIRSPKVFEALFYFLGLLVLPAIFILYKSKRKFTLYVYFLFLFAFGMFFVKYLSNHTSSETKDDKNRKYSEISFIYHGDTVRTTQTYIKGFVGTKNIVLLDTAAGIIDYFERDKVSHLRFRKIKLEELKFDSLLPQSDSTANNLVK